MADFNNTNLADFSGVWVFCEQRQGKLQQTQSPVFPARDMLCENPYIFG